MFFLVLEVISIKIFKPLYEAKEVIITYGIHPFDICSKNPDLWKIIKVTYIFTSSISFFLIGHFVYTRIILKLFQGFNQIKSKITQKTNNSENIKENAKNKNLKKSLNLKIGKDEDNNIVSIPESGLYQNFLITGTIGSGKTSSAMYPFTRQLLEYNSLNPTNKIGMLILDVKGNYYKQVNQYVKKYNLENDLIVLELGSNVYYNPLHKPNLKPQVLANRLKTILLLFSENNTESYWLDKAEEVLSECIKLCRLYNNGYVTFDELHKLVTIPNYYKKKITILRNLFISSKLCQLHKTSIINKITVIIVIIAIFTFIIYILLYITTPYII